MKVSNPVRVLESRISIRHSAVNACGLRMPQPFTFGHGGLRSSLRLECVLATNMKIATAVATPSTPKRHDGRLPHDAGEQADADDAAEREFPHVAEEVVSARARRAVRLRDRRAK